MRCGNSFIQFIHSTEYLWLSNKKEVVHAIIGINRVIVCVCVVGGRYVVDICVCVCVEVSGFMVYVWYVYVVCVMWGAGVWCVWRMAYGICVRG